MDFQTGIAENTLLFGGVRYALWGDFDVIPQFLGSDLADLGDSTTYRLGVARRFSDTFAASVSFTYEEEGDPLVSPLAPSNGQLGVSIGGQYTMDNLVLSAGINYTDIGDANPQLSDTAFADFTDNSAFGWGLKIGYTF